MTEVTGKLSTALADRYRLERHLGEGGMATVYLAHDLKHDRKVALKVLKPELAAVIGAERFLNEIKVTANLQHPNILALYDSGEADSFLYYVMPFIEGESLRDQLDRDKQLGVDEAVEITKSVASALDYAHRHDVIHRDIKPENILIHDGQAMVADFGIALAVTQAGGQRLTETGLSLGTPHYMSPEQATADRDLTSRSDQYSLACVAYEMLAGEPPHLGNSVQAIIAKIITDDAAPITKHRHHVPLHIDEAICKALDKTPADRFATLADFSNALSNPSFTTTVAGTRGTGRTPTTTSVWNRLGPVAAILAVVFFAATVWALGRPQPATPVTRVSVFLDEAQALSGAFAFDLAADGSMLVYQGPAADAVSQMWVRQWDALQGSPIRNAIELGPPALSPDRREVAFTRQGSLRVLPLQGGVARTIVTEGVRCCARWSDDGAWIYFDHLSTGFARVPPSGGPVEIVSQADSATGGFNSWLDVLPGNKALVAERTDADGPSIVTVDIASGETKSLTDGQFPRYGSGYLLYTTPDGRTLMVAPFDVDALEFTRPPVPLIEDVFPPGGGYNYFSVSRTGTMVYLAGSRAPPSYELVWLSRDGTLTPIDPEYTFDPGGNNRGLSLSPDGTRLAITTLEDANYDIWLKELPRGPASRLTFYPGIDVRPRWTPDGQSITFLSDSGFAPNNPAIFAKRATGTGNREMLFDHELPLWEAVMSPDEEWLLTRTGGSTTIAGGRDVWGLRPATDTAAAALIVSPFDEKAITLSPDGRWLVYESDETRRNEIYLRPFPNVNDGLWLVSTDGGVMPRWSHSGREIFFINGNNEMVVATVTPGSDIPVRQRDVLFTLPPTILFRQGEQYALYDVAPDDQRFIMMRAVNLQMTKPELILVENWPVAFEAAQGN